MTEKTNMENKVLELENKLREMENKYNETREVVNELVFHFWNVCQELIKHRHEIGVGGIRTKEDFDYGVIDTWVEDDDYSETYHLEVSTYIEEMELKEAERWLRLAIKAIKLTDYFEPSKEIISDTLLSIYNKIEEKKTLEIEQFRKNFLRIYKEKYEEIGQMIEEQEKAKKLGKIKEKEAELERLKKEMDS